MLFLIIMGLFFGHKIFPEMIRSPLHPFVKAYDEKKLTAVAPSMPDAFNIHDVNHPFGTGKVHPDTGLPIVSLSEKNDLLTDITSTSAPVSTPVSAAALAAAGESTPAPGRNTIMAASLNAARAPGMTSKHFASSSASNALDKLYAGQAQYAIFTPRHDRHEDVTVPAPGSEWVGLESKFNEHTTFTHEIAKLDLSKSLIFPGNFQNLVSEQLLLGLDAIAHVYEGDDNVDENENEGLIFEISIKTNDKEILPRGEIMRRVLSVLYSPELHEVALNNSHFMITANAPLFIQKSQIFKSCSFIIGTQTLQRILDATYYSDFNEAAEAAAKAEGTETDVVGQIFAKMEQLGTKFVVGLGSNEEGVGYKTFDSAHEAGQTLIYDRKPTFTTQTRKIFEYIENMDDSVVSDED